MIFNSHCCNKLGVSEQLGVLIDGESLMNDGVAILLFEIFHEFVVHDTSNKSATDSILHILLKFLQIAGGGPIWGWITARILIFLLAYVYNDAPVEIAATICAAYLTYWSSEYVLGNFFPNSDNAVKAFMMYISVYYEN